MAIPYLKAEDLVLRLGKGSPVLFPTDTLPALGVLPKYSSKLWNIKRRPLIKPLILMGASLEDLFEFVSHIAIKDAERMALTYWPGALTMVLPASGKLVEELNPTSKTIGIRIPSCDHAISLLCKSGPLATTSANISGEDPCLNEEEVLNVFPDLPLLGPGPWPKFSGIASTVIAWQQTGSWQLLRKGAVMPENIKK